MSIDTWLGEIFYCLIGLLFIAAAVFSLRDATLRHRGASGAFWLILAFCFIAGPWVPSWIVGVCVVAMGAITAIWGVGIGKVDTPQPEQVREHANRLGYKVFIPALSLALLALIAATIFQRISLPTSLAVGVGAVLALGIAFLVTRAPARYAAVDGGRMVMDVGPVGILPQLLAALGAVFTAAGVGNVISDAVSTVVPVGSALLGVIAYCVGMALFTMIMGNGFAAFSVITVGIGIPFVIAQGGNPVVVAALGLTAGYCGTLVTPMAANFNILPAALLEMRDKYGVIKAQAPIAVVLLIVHIVLMYALAF